MTNILQRTLGAVGALFTHQSNGLQSDTSQAELYKQLWAYYLNNGLYDQLRLWGQYTDNTYLTECRNPCTRAVEFYPAVIWPGSIEEGLPLVVDSENPNVDLAIRKLWQWSNWASQRQVMVRWGAIMGDVYLKVAQPKDGSPRVYLQLVDPHFVVDKSTDERGYITYCRIDIPQKRRVGDKIENYIHTEIWTQEDYRRYEHKNGVGCPLGQLGQPMETIPLSEWGIDFVPIVHARHINIGGEYGLGCFTLQLSKIDEANIMASRLHKMLFRHNDVTWALQSNMVTQDGRPIPAPRITDSTGTEADILELGSDRIVKLPGNSSLTPLIPNLNYTNSLDILEAQLAEIERDLPETMYYKTKDLPEMSGKALRLVLSAAVAKAYEARGNYEDALIRAQTMALTIGQNIGAWDAAGIGDIGNYKSGDFDHHFAERPIIRTGRDEQAETTKIEVESGIPLTTSLRMSGWTQEELDKMQEDKQAEQQAAQVNLASALLSAQENMNGNSSNGLEQG